MAKANFGVIGLGVMGQNLALNVEEHGFHVAAWNLESDWTDRFLAENRAANLTGTKTLEEFVGALERPRRILMMIAAGKPVDLTLEKLRPLLNKDDVVIDGGNSWFKETQVREAALAPTGICFVGMGVSGGQSGARKGPSLMPGGKKSAYDSLRPVLEAIAAKTASGACVAYVGPDGAGHFVKMVHNGIEYGDMQLIAEAYDLMRRGLGMSADEMADQFAEWNRGALESFLIHLTAHVLRVRDAETKEPLVDRVLDKAGQKGTGKWTAQVSLELGVAVPTMAAALDARVLSSMKADRVQAEKLLRGPSSARPNAPRAELVAAIKDALWASKVCSYAQGMNLIAAGSREYKWNVQLGEMARIWTGGCIIRARLLSAISSAYQRDPGLSNLLCDEALRPELEAAQAGWRRAVTTAQSLGIAVPALAASLSYFDSVRTASLPQNLTQAQRDAFGAHTYERWDHPERGPQHTEWVKETI